MPFLANNDLAKPAIDSKNPNSRDRSLSTISYSLCNPNTRR
ncbi:hypothetical protein [Microcoleus sp. N3A4]